MCLRGISPPEVSWEMGEKNAVSRSSGREGREVELADGGLGYNESGVDEEQERMTMGCEK